MNLMDAVVFTGKEQLHIERVPLPVCGGTEALLRVAACGICGGDARSYFVGDQFTGQRRIPGHEVVGQIVEVGARVTEWQPGDRVALAADIHCGQCYYCRRGLFNLCDTLRIIGKHMDGGMADFLLLSSDILEHGILHRIPEGLSMLEAALSEPLSSVLASHDALRIGAGETVVVLGCGPMGVLHYELLRIRQARPIMVDMSPERLQLVRQEFGATCTIHVGEEDVLARVRELTENVGADVVITATPAPAAVAQSVHLVRRRGRIGLFGGLPSHQAEVPMNINRIHYAELSLIGNFSYHPNYHRRALEVLASAQVCCDKLITTYILEDTERALQDIKQGRVLKAVILPNGGALL
jgi:L-iditol 2-dehydrogenase